MIAIGRAFTWALSFGVFLHFYLEHRPVWLALPEAVFWTWVVDRLISDALR